MGLLIVLVGEGDVKGSGEAVAKVVAGTGLECLPVMHHALDGVGPLCTGKLLLIGLLATDNRHSQNVLAEVCIGLQLLLGLGNGLLRGCMQGMALLPQEFPVTEEGTGGFLPTEHAAPLVIQQGQISPGVDNVAPMVAEQRLGGRTDAQPLLQLLATAMGDPRTFRSKAGNVILLLLEQALRNQHGHGHIGVAGALKVGVQLLLDVLPDGIAIGTEDKHALGAGIVDELCLGADVGIPLGEVHLHIGDAFHLFLLFSHFVFILSRSALWS